MHRFIAFDGIDGAGKETQSKLLFEYLKKKGVPAERLAYPDCSKPLGRMIHEFLHKKFELPADSQLLLYTADMLKDRESIERWIGEGRIVVADRYFTSSLAYQVLNGVPEEKVLELARVLNLPKPDVTVYLRISPETALKRKEKEKSKLDRFEGNLEFLRNVRERYEHLAKNSVFCKWVVVDGEKSIEEVFVEVKKVLGI